MNMKNTYLQMTLHRMLFTIWNGKRKNTWMVSLSPNKVPCES